MSSLTAKVLAPLVLASTWAVAQQGAAPSTAGAPASNTEAPGLSVAKNGSQQSTRGSPDFFTGTVRVDPLFQPKAPSRVSGGLVTFEPAARSAWHTHPLGQTLIVTAGIGRAQRWGGPVEDIRPGDVVSIAPGQKHWHGAAPTTAMSHIAITEALDGRNVDWLEKVTDEQYGR